MSSGQAGWTVDVEPQDDGELVYASVTDTTLKRIPNPPAGTVLTSNGPGQPPSFQDVVPDPGDIDILELAGYPGGTSNYLRADGSFAPVVTTDADPGDAVADLDGTGAAGASTDYSRADHKHADVNRPSDDEKAALVGTEGTPSDTNRFVTDEDPRLGASGALIFNATTLNFQDTPTDMGAATLTDAFADASTRALIKVELAGDLFNNTGGARTYTFNLVIGSKVLPISGAATVANVTISAVHIVCFIHIFTNGNMRMQCHGRINPATADGTPVTDTMRSSWTFDNVVDYRGSQTVKLQVFASASGASSSFTGDAIFTPISYTP